MKKLLKIVIHSNTKQKSQKICEKAIDYYLLALEYVPDYYKTQEMWENV